MRIKSEDEMSLQGDMDPSEEASRLRNSKEGVGERGFGEFGVGDIGFGEFGVGEIGFGEFGLSLWVFRVIMNVRVIAMKENNAQKTPFKSNSRDF